LLSRRASTRLSLEEISRNDACTGGGGPYGDLFDGQSLLRGHGRSAVILGVRAQILLHLRERRAQGGISRRRGDRRSQLVAGFGEQAELPVQPGEESGQLSLSGRSPAQSLASTRRVPVQRCEAGFAAGFPQRPAHGPHAPVIRRARMEEIRRQSHLGLVCVRREDDLTLSVLHLDLVSLRTFDSLKPENGCARHRRGAAVGIEPLDPFATDAHGAGAPAGVLVFPDGGQAGERRHGGKPAHVAGAASQVRRAEGGARASAQRPAIS
jgi:hypothetical protein